MGSSAASLGDSTGADRTKGLQTTSLLQPCGKKPPLQDDLITGKEGMAIREETGG